MTGAMELSLDRRTFDPQGALTPRGGRVKPQLHVEQKARAAKNTRPGFGLVPRYLDIGRRLLNARKHRRNPPASTETASDFPHQAQGGTSAILGGQDQAGDLGKYVHPAPGSPQIAPLNAQERPKVLPGQACYADTGCDTVLPILPAAGDIIRGLQAMWQWLFPIARIDPATLPRPPGLGNPEFGKLIGWTRGGVKAENLAQTRELIRQLPSRIDQLRKAGVTRQMAERWSQFYRQIASENPANPNALARSQLMEAIANLL